MIDPRAINQEVTQGNFQLERVLKLLAMDDNTFFPAKTYLVIDTSNAAYADVVKRFQRTYYDGSALVQTSIEGALDVADDHDTILIVAKDIPATGTDPESWAETNTIAAGQSLLSIVGVTSQMAQGRQPQIKIGGSSTTVMFDVRAMGTLFYGLTINGASSTGGGIKLNSSAGSYDSGGTVIQNCHFKNLKGSGAAATGGAIFWSTEGDNWYVTIKDNEFIDNRCSIGMLGTSNSVPRHVKILRNLFGAAVNTTVDADIYVAESGIKDLIIDSNIFACPQTPAYASSPTAARYISVGASTTGIISNNVFAETDGTYGAAGNAVIAPANVLLVNNHEEAGLIARA